MNEPTPHHLSLVARVQPASLFIKGHNCVSYSSTCALQTSSSPIPTLSSREGGHLSNCLCCLQPACCLIASLLLACSKFVCIGALAWEPGELELQIREGGWITAAASRPMILKQVGSLTRSSLSKQKAQASHVVQGWAGAEGPGLRSGCTTAPLHFLLCTCLQTHHAGTQLTCRDL